MTGHEAIVLPLKSENRVSDSELSISLSKISVSCCGMDCLVIILADLLYREQESGDKKSTTNFQQTT